MSRNEKTEEVVEVKQEEEIKPEATEEVKDEEEKPVEVDKEEEQSEEVDKEEEQPEEKIDPRLEAILALNKKDKISEKDKQAKIYAAMHKLKVVRK